MNENDAFDVRDRHAQEMFEVPYHHLSAWGKREVDLKVGKIEFPKTPSQARLPSEPEVATLRQENERLAQKLASVKQENLDLWDEVTELKTELAQLRADLNLPST